MRRILLAIATAAAAAVFISGCEKLWGGDGYTWYRGSDPAKRYDWYALPQHEVDQNCGPNAYGCAVVQPLGVCHVFSIFLEVDARKFKINGRSHFEHEVGPLLEDGKTPDPSKGYGHCAGHLHKEPHARGT